MIVSSLFFRLLPWWAKVLSGASPQQNLLHESLQTRMRYFTADWHFGHSNIIDYTDRPHQSVENMNDHFVREIKERVDPDDEIWCLGDLTGPPTQMENLRKRLASIPCDVHWVKGNHDPDPEPISDLAECHGHRVEFRSSYKDRQDGQRVRIVLDHYPLYTWNGWRHGSIHLHGHVHGGISSENSGKRRADVGVDTNRWPGAYSGISERGVVSKLTRIPALEDQNSGTGVLGWLTDQL